MSIEKVVQQLKKLNDDIDKKINNKKSEEVYLLNSLKEQNIFLSDLEKRNEILISKIQSNNYELKNLRDQLKYKNKVEEKKLSKYYQKLNEIIKNLKETKEKEKNFKREFHILEQLSNIKKEEDYKKISNDLDEMLKKIGL